MALDDPTICAVCDRCDFISDPMTMTSLAGGGWDARNVPKKLKHEGWRIDGDTFVCPDCVELEAEKTKP